MHQSAIAASATRFPPPPPDVFKLPLWSRAPLMLWDEALRQTCCASCVGNDCRQASARLAAFHMEAAQRNWQQAAQFARAALGVPPPLAFTVLPAAALKAGMDAAAAYWTGLMTILDETSAGLSRHVEEKLGNPAEDLPDLLTRLSVDPLLELEQQSDEW